MPFILNSISNIKVGIQHKIVRVRCYRSKIVLFFLFIIVSIGISDSFRKCPIYTNRIIILVASSDALCRNDYSRFSNNFKFWAFGREPTAVSVIQIWSKPWFKIPLTLPKLMKLKKLNSSSVTILTTSKFGFISSYSSLLNGIGGFAICRFFF